MRISIASVVASLALAGLTAASESEAAIRKFTNIPAQGLGSALQSFEKDRNLQLIFVAEDVRDVRTRGASGELTSQETLEKLLDGTGLTYRFVDEDTITILPTQPAVGQGKTADVEPARKAGFWSRLRLAQGAQSTSDDAADAAGQSAAQADDPNRIEEVVVTSQKREESVLDVPISMTVLGADQLEALRVQELSDYVFDVPNATFYSTGKSSPRIALRGVNGFTGGQYNPIAVTVDDSSFGVVDIRGILTSQVFDVERIEILRGPQGTLTGSSSLGGTVNIITAKPNMDALEFKGTLDFGRYNTQLRKAIINVPLSDTFAFRTAAYTETSDGAVKNIGPGGGSSSADNYGVRVATLWQPTDALQINMSLAYEDLRYGLDDGLLINRHFGGEGVTAARQALLASLGGDYFDAALDFMDQAGNDGGNYKIDDPDHTHVKNLFGSLRTTYDFGGAALDFIYGYYNYKLDGSQDLDRSEYSMQRNHYTADEKVDSFELRLSSRGEGPVGWVLGATYLDDQLPQGGRLGGGNPVVGGAYPLIQKFSNYRGIQTSAAFANVFWDITERLHLSAGARYSQVKNGFGRASAFSDDDPIPAIVQIKGELNELDPRVALNFDLTDDLMLYAQYATAFRPGYGNDPLGVGRHETTIGEIDVPAVVDSEQVTNYEVGFKGSFLDHRLQLTGAAFKMDYDNMQVIGGNLLTPGLEFVMFDVNGGSGEVSGFELEGQVAAGAGWNLLGSVGYVDSTIDRLQGVEPGVDIPGIRPWTATLSASHERQVTEQFRGVARLDLRWQDGTNTDFAGQPITELPEFHTVDISAGIVNDRWNLTAYMENVLDETYWVGAAGGLSLRGSRVIFVPRTFGIRFSVNLKSPR